MYSEEESDSRLSHRVNEGAGRRKLMHEYDDIEDELYKTFKKKRQSSIRESNLFNPPAPTLSMNNSDDHFKQHNAGFMNPDNTENYTQGRKLTLSQNSPSMLSPKTSYKAKMNPLERGAYNTSKANYPSKYRSDSQRNGKKRTDELQDDLLNIVQDCFDETNEMKDRNNKNQSRENDNYLDFLDNTNRVEYDGNNAKKKSHGKSKRMKYSDDEEETNILDIFTSNKTSQDTSSRDQRGKEKKRKDKREQSSSYKENRMFDYSPSQPTQDDDYDAVSVNDNKKYKKHVDERKSTIQREISPDEPMISSKINKCRVKAENNSEYADIFPSLVVDSDNYFDSIDNDNFEFERKISSNTDNLFSKSLKILINENDVPAFVVSDKSFNANSLSPNICFMWTLICSMKYDRQKDSNKSKSKTTIERSLVKQFRKEAENRILYADEEKLNYEEFDNTLLNSFLNNEYHKIIGRKSEFFNDVIKKDMYKLFPLSKRVLNMISSLSSIRKHLNNINKSLNSEDNRAKASRDGRIGIPLIDKNRRRKLISNDSENCIEIIDDDDNNNKDKYKKYSSNSRDNYYNENRENTYSRNSPKIELASKNVVSLEKTPAERIAELKKMLPMIGKKPIKKSKNVKSLLEQARMKNSVPHKPGPYQFNVTVKPVTQLVYTEPKNIDMQISDESDSPKEDAHIPSYTLDPSTPLPPLPAEVQYNPDEYITYSPNLASIVPPPPPPPEEEEEKQQQQEQDQIIKIAEENISSPSKPVKKSDPIPYPIENQNSEVKKAAENASKMADSMIGQQSTGVKQQLEAMAAFLNRGNEDKKEDSTKSSTEQPYEYLNKEEYQKNQSYDSVDPMAYWQEKSGTSQDYWNNCNYQEGYQNEEMNYDYSYPEVHMENVPDVEWFECEYVETSEYTGIEPPIPGHQRVILPPLPGIPSTENTPSSNSTIICKAIEVPTKAIVKEEKTIEPIKEVIIDKSDTIEELSNKAKVPIQETKASNDWTENIRMFVFKTEKTICQMAEAILFEMGIQNMYPEDIKTLPYNAQFQVFIHKPDILEIDRLPNLSELKNDHRVYFLRFSDIEDIKNYRSESMLSSGGQIVIDDPGLVLATPEYLQQLLNFMESQTLSGNYWSLKIHADSMQALAMKTAEDEGVRESSIYLMLTSPQYGYTGTDIPPIVEVLTACHVPACTGQPCTTMEYLDCLRAMQVVNIERHRETYLFTDKRIHNDDNGEFKLAGITLTNIEEFVKNIAIL